MPFKSEAQRRKCWSLKRQMELQGKKSNWDCEKWEKETKKLKRNSKKSKKSKK